MSIFNSDLLVDAICATVDLKNVVQRLNDSKDECVRTSEYEDAAIFRNCAIKISEAIDMLEVQIYESKAE